MFCVPCLMTILCVASPATAGDGSSDAQFLAGLRERGLFGLAETYCLEQLTRPQLSDPQRADLVIELSRCLAQWAAGSPPEMRGPLWQRAEQVTEDFAQAYPQSPRLPLVRLQRALGLLDRGELARQEAEVLAGRDTLLDEARTQLRAAVGQLRELDAETDRLLREQSLAARPDPNQLSAVQLASLKNNVRYELARALRNQAQCYAAESADRADALTQAVELLGWLTQLDAANPLMWKSRIDLIVCHRLLGDRESAGRQLDALEKMKPPAEVELRARAERIRLALAGDRLDEAMGLLAAGRQIGAVVSPELDYAWLETYLRAWRAATADDRADAAGAADFQAKAVEMVRWIEGRYGPYWTRRAEMLLAGYVRTSADSVDVDTMVRAAESAFRSGQFDEALAAYDRARFAAAARGDAARAFELGYVAATIQHQRNRHAEALARYREIAKAMPSNAQADEAHRLAIYHAEQLMQKQPPDTPAPDLASQFDQYQALLDEHLQLWPEGAGADAVWRQMGRLREHRGDWEGAIQAYRSISPQDGDFLSTVEAIERCCRAWLDARKAEGKPTDRMATEAAAWFESLLPGTQGTPAQPWGPLQQSAALAAARLRLNYTSSGYAEAQRIVVEALQRATDAPPQWKAAAESLLVFALAGDGRRQEAGEVLSRMSAGPSDQLLDMLDGLGRMAATARPEVRTELAQLQLNTIQLLGPNAARLTPPQSQMLQRIRAQALADTGQTAAALEAYRSLSTAYPLDGEVQESYAALLSAKGDLASRQAALEQWRGIEKKSPPGSPRWFRAKYAVALTHFELGNKQQAAQVIELLRLLHPELGGPEMKARFEGLLERCRQ